MKEKIACWTQLRYVGLHHFEPVNVTAYILVNLLRREIEWLSSEANFICRSAAQFPLSTPMSYDTVVEFIRVLQYSSFSFVLVLYRLHHDAEDKGKDTGRRYPVPVPSLQHSSVFRLHSNQGLR